MSALQSGFGSGLEAFGQFMLGRATTMAAEQDFQKKQEFLKKLEEENAKKIEDPSLRQADYSSKQWILKNKFGDVLRTVPMTGSEVEAHDLGVREKAAQVGSAESANKEAAFNAEHQQEAFAAKLQSTKSENALRFAQMGEANARTSEIAAQTENVRSNNPKNMSPEQKAAARAKLINDQFKQELESYKMQGQDYKDDNPFDPAAAKANAEEQARAANPELNWPTKKEPTKQKGGILSSMLEGAAGALGGNSRQQSGGGSLTKPVSTNGGADAVASQYAQLSNEYQQLQNSKRTPQAAQRMMEILDKLRSLKAQLSQQPLQQAQPVQDFNQ